jgi:small subunit ribosomal protein S17e
LKLDRTRRLSEELMQRHPDSFGDDFEQNKKALEELALIPSKQLRNRIAGYLAKSNKEEPDEGEQPQGEEQQA